MTCFQVVCVSTLSAKPDTFLSLAALWSLFVRTKTQISMEQIAVIACGVITAYLAVREDLSKVHPLVFIQVNLSTSKMLVALICV